MNVDVANPLVNDLDIGDLVVDEVEEEVDELDVDVLDVVAENKVNKLEASEEEEDAGNVVVHALPTPVPVPFLMAIPTCSHGPGSRGKFVLEYFFYQF
jgi:hypothetical protein